MHIGNLKGKQVIEGRVRQLVVAVQVVVESTLDYLTATCRQQKILLNLHLVACLFVCLLSFKLALLHRRRFCAQP